MGASWVTKEQKVFLKGYIPEFREAQDNSTTTSFFGRVYNAFVERWPIPVPSDKTHSGSGEGTAGQDKVVDKSVGVEENTGKGKAGKKKKAGKGKAKEDLKPESEEDLRLVSRIVWIIRTYTHHGLETLSLVLQRRPCWEVK